MSPRVLVVEHEAACPPALVGEWLVAAGCTLEVCRPYLGDALPDLTSYDGVLVLGGEMGANDDATHAWLPPLKAGIRSAYDAGTPLLGICLGHQVVAVALGGVVAPNPRGKTVGLQLVGWTGEADGDALVGDRTGEEVAIHWNNDVVVHAPAGAVVLARTADGEAQAIRFGPVTWGIQAHPEADAAILERWAGDSRDDDVASARDRAAVDAATEAADALRRHWEPVARRFAAVVQERA